MTVSDRQSLNTWVGGYWSGRCQSSSNTIIGVIRQNKWKYLSWFTTNMQQLWKPLYCVWCVMTWMNQLPTSSFVAFCSFPFPGSFSRVNARGVKQWRMLEVFIKDTVTSVVTFVIVVLLPFNHFSVYTGMANISVQQWVNSFLCPRCFWPGHFSRDWRWVV